MNGCKRCFGLSHTYFERLLRGGVEGVERMLGVGVVVVVCVCVYV